MIFASLVAYYERLVAQGLVPSFGLTQEKIGFAVVIDREGTIKSITSLSNPDDKKSKWKILTVPASFKRPGVSPASFFLWDKCAYVLGVEQRAGSDAPTLNVKSHAAFKALHLDRLADATDAGLIALRNFVEKWDPAEWATCEHVAAHLPGILGANIVFRLYGEMTSFIHESLAAKELVARYSTADDAAMGTCLVSGEVRPIARLHPAIKGVRDAQSSGASLVSFNLNAFDSYGKDRGANAPVSVYAAFAYTTVLNYLLMRDAQHRQCIQIGDATVVFWAEAPTKEQRDEAETLLLRTLGPDDYARQRDARRIASGDVNAYPDDINEAAALRVALEKVSKGRAIKGLDPGLNRETKLFVLGLSPNASRLSVRYWFRFGLTEFATRLGQHFDDLNVEPVPARSKRSTSVWRLLLATAAQEDQKNVPAQLGGSVMRAILGGGLYPLTIMSNALMRMRTDGHVSWERVALCKAVLTRELRLKIQENKQEVPVALDEKNLAIGYLLGRTFAMLEELQRLALGNVNAGIADRYYASASAVPQQTFFILLKGARHHFSSASKTPKSAGAAVNLYKKIRSTIDLVEGGTNIPKALSPAHQSWFALGYFHQSAALYKNPNKEKPESIEETEEAN